MRFIIILIFLFNYTVSNGQVSNYGSNTEVHSLLSKENKKYTIKVTFPHDYNDNSEYKTLYYLDSWWLSELVLGTYAILNLSEKIENVVLIGITINGDLKDWNTQRTLDFTPSQYDVKEMGFQMKAGRGDDSITLDLYNTGGADVFADFLENKVFKLIEQKYPNLTESRALLGHSYGGLFSFYTMQQKPQLFSDYIIISPSLWWNKSELIKNELFTGFKNNNTYNNIYLCYGDLESQLISRSNKNMDIILRDLAQEKVAYKFKVYEEADHNSILPRGIYDGLLYTYGN